MTRDLTAIVGATVIDGTGRQPIPNASILISGERIANVSRTEEGGAPPDANVFDATGNVVIPGLVDAHAHVVAVNYHPFTRTGDDPNELFDFFMRGLIACGITTARDTGDFDAASGMPLLKQSVPYWPRGFGAGPVIDGTSDPPIPWEHVVILDDEAKAGDAVRGVADLGVDFLKVYVWLKEPVLRAVVEEGHRLGLRVAAHVGHLVTAKDAIKAGVDTLEHVRVGRELLSDSDLEQLQSLPERDISLDALIDYRPWRYIDPESDAADQLIALMRERGVFLTPTLTLAQCILKGDVKDVVDPPENSPLPQSVRSAFDDFVYTKSYTSEDFSQAKDELRRQIAFVGRAQRSGVKVVAGTDLPNPFLGPAALHEELRLFVEEAGISPMDAIVTATKRGAEVLSHEAEFGTLEKGKLADLVVLRHDPLKDIRNTRGIVAVFKSGVEVVGPHAADPWPLSPPQVRP